MSQYILNNTMFRISRIFPVFTLVGIFIIIAVHNSVCNAQLTSNIDNSELEEKFKVYPKRFVSKCCDLGEMYDDRGGELECISVPEINFPDLDLGENTSYKYGKPCKQNYVVQGENLTLLNYGDLKVFYRNTQKIKFLRPHEYCIEILGPVKEENEISQLFELIAVVCSPINDDTDKWRFTLYPVMMLISVFCLILTVLVHLILWEHQNLHSWLQFSYTISLLLSFGCLAVIQLWSFDIRQISKHFCNAMGSLTHFFFLSVFFWLTSMNFDLWLTFGQNTITRYFKNLSPSTFRRTFLYYNLFSYGIPAIFATVAITFDYIYRNHTNPPVILPKFGERTCHFHDFLSQLPYMYGPLGVLLCVDIAFFLSTICSLKRQYQETEFATKRSTATAQDRKRLVLFLKLFIIMGLLWVFEFLSWASLTFQTEHGVLIRLFIATDILNCSKGIAIFVIFVCKRDVFQKLREKFKKTHFRLSLMKIDLVAKMSDSSQKSSETCSTVI